LDATDAQADERLAVCLFKTGASVEGEQAARRLLTAKTPSRDVDLLLTYAEYLLNNGQLPAALEQARLAVEAQPRHPIAHLWMARLLLAQNDAAGAAREAEESVRLAPDLPFAHNLLIRVYRVLGRAAEAEHEALWMRRYDDARVRK
jgi:predicted Zn-dependent protease